MLGVEWMVEGHWQKQLFRNWDYSQFQGMMVPQEVSVAQLEDLVVLPEADEVLD